MFSIEKDVRIVLVNPSHPGNIGAVARAMKTMGLTNLYLVQPRQFPDPKATELAVHATDILEQAVITPTLAAAVEDCHLVLGTSARERTLNWSTLTARVAAQQAVQEAIQGRNVAIVFGRERTGLTNDELQLCHFQVAIPANPAYSSLNLAAAVQVIAYEIRMASLNALELISGAEQAAVDDLATVTELEGFYEHLTQVLIASEFIDKRQPKQAIGRLRRLFNRSRLDKTEINILRGVLTALQKFLPVK